MPMLHQDEMRLWREYCAPVEIPIGNFMDIQAKLLTEQLELAGSDLWPASLPNAYGARNLAEFRDLVPLQRWADYKPLLQPERLEGQPADAHWIQTSWSDGDWKRVPWTQRFYEAQCRHVVAAFMLSVAKEAGDVRVGHDFRVLPFLPESPFASALLSMGVTARNVVNILSVPSKAGEEMTIARRFKALFERGMDAGVDCVVGMSSTLLMARREFRRVTDSMSMKDALRIGGGKTALQWAAAHVHSRGKKDRWEPRSMMRPKSVIAWGADTTQLAPTIEAQWGAPVFQLYASSEGGIMAMHDWRRQGLTPLPTSVFMEFLPMGAAEDASELRLLDELEEGKVYELVLTSFYGMPFMRLRQGDLLQVNGRNEHGVPEFSFFRRGDGIIDLGSIARINEPTLSAAMAMAGFGDLPWVARKEYVNSRPILRVYAGGDADTAKVLQGKLHRALGMVDHHYREATYTLGYTLMQVLPLGAAAESANAGDGLVTIEPGVKMNSAVASRS